MPIRLFLLISLVTSTAACGPPSPEAPTDLSDLVRYLYREWDNEDPRFLEDGLANLDEFLGTVDMTVEAKDRSWVPDNLTVEDVAAVSWPDERDLEAMIPITVAGHGDWPVTDHARLQTEPDQLITEPTATRYERTVLNEDDPSCYWDLSCALVETTNDVRRDNLVMAVDFILLKDFRWARIGPEVEGEEARWAVVGRSWFEQSWTGDSGNTHLWTSFAMDVWLGQPDGTTLRTQTLWSESEIVDVEDEVVRNLLRSSIDDIFDAGDAAIEELYHSED